MLGIIDWGIGGIGVFREVNERWSGIAVKYFSDTGATPYGKMSSDELVLRLTEVIVFLRERGVTHVMIACNAAGTAIPNLHIDGVEISGVIDPAIRLCISKNPSHIGVIGGRRTVLSGVYRKAFRDAGIEVSQRIAQPLSAMIERGDTGSNELRHAVKQIVSPLKTSSHLLLACTHYPAVSHVIRDHVSTETELIDPASAAADVIGKWRIKSHDGPTEFFTTGDISAMKRSARLAFRVEIENVNRVEFGNRNNLSL